LSLAPGKAPDRGREVGIRGVRIDPFNGIGSFSDAPDRSGVRDRLTFLPEPQSQAGAFKTPTLREVARTAPYMHDGRYADLEQVMSFYSAEETPTPNGIEVGQRERTMDLIPHLTKGQQSDLIEFLRTLSSPALPEALERAPARP
jgi:cytochrome c peroxidase